MPRSSEPEPPAALRLGSSLRRVLPAETLARAAALMPRWGISRVSEITRMDRLGLPVCIGVRPRGQVLRVHAGKGLSAEEARVGALMEALEFAVAEPRGELPRMAFGALVDQLAPHARWMDLAPVAPPPADDERLPALPCEVLGRRGGAVMLPAELIVAGRLDGPPLFGPSSNGLASGNTPAEATLHGLLEVLERDTLAMNQARDDSQLVDRLPPPFDALAARWQELGVRLAVRHLPNRHGLPCFEAVLDEPEDNRVNLASGSGLHLDRGIALARAVCEAAQSRLSLIHGGREDITAFYAKYRRPEARRDGDARLREQLFDASRRIAFAKVPDRRPPADASLDEILAELLRGLPPVLRHRFDPAGLDGLEVVRVIVPGCAPNTPGRLTPRLLDRVLGHG
ncbi:YcaO-like family protein [Pelomonas sp. KK5]|uniref:YcaO-like family protein n=1 Tax=Pelomonas sp. KK5 TaxID=1855730 RepID=UPI00097C758A|nr:YcaO-like family protein [Pelomonas sp. KK5]